MKSNILFEIENKFGGKSYKNYVAIVCPFHEDHTPSCIVHADTYSCKSCGAYGKTESLLGSSVEVPIYSLPDKQSEFKNPFSKWSYKQSLKDTLKAAWINNIEHPCQYLIDRGIPTRSQFKYGIGILENWILFPIDNIQGEIIGATGRRGENNPSPAKYINPFGQDPNLLYVPDYNIIKRSNHILLVFGILDAVTLAMMGLPAISTTTGKQLGDDPLWKYPGKIIVIPDKHEELDGYKVANKFGLRGKLHLPDYPDDAKDVNDLWRFHNKEFIERMRFDALVGTI